MATAKKYPEFELPPLLAATIKEYLGPAKMANLTATQRGQLMDGANELASRVGLIIEPPPENPATGD